MIHVVPAVTAIELCAARDLFLEYPVSRGFELCFQDFDREVAP